MFGESVGYGFIPIEDDIKLMERCLETKSTRPMEEYYDDLERRGIEL